MEQAVERKIIRSKRVRELLDTSVTGLQRLRKLASFPRPVAIPGHPRWLEDEILNWRDRRDLAEVAAGSVLADRQDLVALLDGPSHAECMVELERLAESARRAGRTKVADLFDRLTEELRAAGPTVMPGARRLLRLAALTGTQD